MIRLQHYVELCYLVVGIMLLVDSYRIMRWKEYRWMKRSDYVRAFVLVAAAPFTLAYILYKGVRN